MKELAEVWCSKCERPAIWNGHMNDRPETEGRCEVHAHITSSRSKERK